MTIDDWKRKRPLRAAPGVVPILLTALIFASCGKQEKVSAGAAEPVIATGTVVTVGVTKVARRTLTHQLTISSELVPFQEIDVYAKESGYVKQLSVDYGSHVKQGQVMAVLEIPELEALLQQDEAAIKSASDQVTHAEHEVARVDAQHRVSHLQYERLAGVLKMKPGLVAQQEVDDAQGKDLAAEAQLEASKSALDTAQSQLVMMKAKLTHDQVLFAYSKITAPFDGVVTQRFANLGALMQAGTSSNTQTLPLVRLSQEDLFRLVIPVPESAVRFIHTGDVVEVRVPALSRSFAGKVARTSIDVSSETRTLHTEVDVKNQGRLLLPGLYAEAVLNVGQAGGVLAVPLQAINHQDEKTTVYVVTPDSKLEDRVVSLGIETANYAEVAQGLHEGELVVLSDRSGLKPGQTVQPQPVDVVSFGGKNQ